MSNPAVTLAPTQTLIPRPEFQHSAGGSHHLLLFLSSVQVMSPTRRSHGAGCRHREAAAALVGVRARTGGRPEQRARQAPGCPAKSNMLAEGRPPTRHMVSGLVACPQWLPHKAAHLCCAIKSYNATISVLQVIMLAVALPINNLHHKRRYPTYWIGSPVIFARRPS